MTSGKSMLAVRPRALINVPTRKNAVSGLGCLLKLSGSCLSQLRHNICTIISFAKMHDNKERDPPMELQKGASLSKSISFFPWHLKTSMGLCLSSSRVPTRLSQHTKTLDEK
eukprot:1160936-Pelagomonas_calceolata.AAC.11